MPEKRLTTAILDHENSEKKQETDSGFRLGTVNTSKFSISCASNTLRDSEYQKSERSEHTEEQAKGSGKSKEIGNEYLQEKQIVNVIMGFQGHRPNIRPKTYSRESR